MAVKKAGCDGGFDGLCCRMVIETKRVFDGCALTDENITLTLTTESQIPQGSEFASARAVSSEFTIFSIVDCGDGCSRVSGEIVTKFAVVYCLGGVPYTVAATHKVQRETLLRLPSSAIVPYTIEVQSVMNVGSGAVLSANAVSVSGCLLQIIKVTASVDILVPTYGYCKYPPCTGSACSGFGGRVFPAYDGDDA